MIYDVQDETNPEPPTTMLVDPGDYTRRKQIPPLAHFEDLLKPVFRAGKLCMDLPDLQTVRAFRAERLNCLHPSIRRLLNPHQYPVGLESTLNRSKMELILKERGHHPE